MCRAIFARPYMVILEVETVFCIFHPFLGVFRQNHGLHGRPCLDRRSHSGPPACVAVVGFEVGAGVWWPRPGQVGRFSGVLSIRARMLFLNNPPNGPPGTNFWRRCTSAAAAVCGRALPSACDVGKAAKKGGNRFQLRISKCDGLGRPAVSRQPD